MQESEIVKPKPRKRCLGQVDVEHVVHDCGSGFWLRVKGLEGPVCRGFVETDRNPILTSPKPPNSGF